MVSKYKSLAIIIPVHNEEGSIETVVSKVIVVISKLENPCILLLIDDGSTDQSLKIILKLLKQYPKILKLESHRKNLGYGAGVNTGIKYAIKHKIDYALFMDSDLTNNPKDIKRFAGEIIYSPDCVKASRYINSGKVINVPRGKYLISRIGNKFASILFNTGVKDCTNGFRMIKVEKFKGVKLSEKGFAVIMEEMYILKKKHASFKEIPITLTIRKKGKSHFKYGLAIFLNYLKYPILSVIK